MATTSPTSLVTSGVVANCLCPGFNVTGLGRELGFSGPLSKLLNWLGIGDPERGADIIARLATDPALGNRTGAYVSVRNADDLKPFAPADDEQMGGDEFAILQRSAPDGGVALANRCLAAFDAPFLIKGLSIGLGVSIGIAVAAHCNQEGEGLMQAADRALYRAKAEGRNTWRIAEVERTATRLYAPN